MPFYLTSKFRQDHAEYIKTSIKSNKLTKRELVKIISSTTDVPVQEVQKIVDILLLTISTSLKNCIGVHLVGFGKFVCVTRKARMGRNLQTGARIKIPSRMVAKFKASKQFLT